MAQTEQLDALILEAIARQVAEKGHHRRRLKARVRHPSPPRPTHLAESFPVWSLDPASYPPRGARVRELGRPSGAWHHQIRHSNGVAQYARSRGEGLRPEDWRVVEIVESPLAGAIEDAVAWLDIHARDRSIARLVHIPAYLMVAFWLESSDSDRILLVQAPRTYAGEFDMRRLYPAAEFLARLRLIPRVKGVLLSTAQSLPSAWGTTASRLKDVASTQPVMFGSVLVGCFLLALVALAFGAPYLGQPAARQMAFVAALALLTGEFAAIGICLGRGPAGVIIDARNCMSLSKLQACAWTILVLSALLVGLSFNLAGGARSLALQIPKELLQAMGLSAAALAASPALLSLKTRKTPTPGALSAAGIAPTDQPGPTPLNSGVLMTNTSIGDAHWTDMITGDEVGNFATADLGKIQQLLVSLLLLGVYSNLTYNAFAGLAPTLSLPKLDPTFVGLLAVSQGTYLAYKAAPHTTTA